MKISARNQLKGKIKSVQVDGLMAEVEIDIGGQSIVSVITRHSAQGMALAAGDTVFVVIKSTEVMLGKDH